MNASIPQKNGNGFFSNVDIQGTLAASFMTNVVVIGKEGYIGGCLMEHLISEKKYNIIAPTIEECNFLYQSDVETFFSNLGIKNCHVIFAAVINKSSNHSLNTFLKNIKMVSNFIAGQKEAHISSIIFLSSVDVYGNKIIPPITEETKINPDNWYGLSKYVSEWLMNSSREIFCPITIFRLPGVFGNSPKDNSVINRLIKNIMNQKKVIISGNGEIYRDYVFVYDVAKIIECFILNSYPGIYNVATGKKYYITDIVEILRTIMKIDFDIIYEPADQERKFDIFFDNTKLTQVLSHFQFKSLEDGIASYLT